MKKKDAVQNTLEKIYGKDRGASAFDRISPLMKNFPVRQKKDQDMFSQKDVILITYGDTLTQKGEMPLDTLREFANTYLEDVFSGIHILPFFPFSSDDGFSVIDFFAVNPKLGSWTDINAIGKGFQLMFDLVLNHVSAQSRWFEQYLAGKQGFEALAIEADPSADLSQVTRPRTLPLLTEFKKRTGETVHVWTTFSADQIDLNYESLDVLEKMIEALLFYVEQGASLLRLDAVAYLWKEIGTTCIHLPQAHDMVKLFRGILDEVAPDVMIITETNVPHEENVSYFGDGRDEAQVVYNFTLPPLLFYSFVKEDATALSEWAKTLVLESQTNTFLNFTASHDGIGVRPLEGILPKKEIDGLVQMVKKNGGDVSYKQNPDGSQSPYELNITYVDALLNKEADDDPCHAQRFLASQAIQFALPGIPATYIHSLLGSRNWKEGVEQTRRARTINRESLNMDQVMSDLENPESFRSNIFFPYLRMIRVRRDQPAFHPNAAFEILDVGSKVFGIARHAESQDIYALTNVSSRPVTISLSKNTVPSRMTDLLTGEDFSTDSICLGPYQFVWLREEK